MTASEFSADIGFAVNGRDVEMRVPIRMTVAELVRDRLRLTGTKVSCEIQVCGVCTVLVNGHPVSACSMLACDLDGTSLLTIEGLANGRELHPVQQAFIETNAFQCGFCTPGFVLMAYALLEHDPEPDAEAIREWLDGNICRCTGYAPIEQAVSLAGTRLAEGQSNVVEGSTDG
ncbi:MAG: aerobic-type carbon monoxide dehydrogenase small subunit (CoxS/CutS family) [Verrucomicrobiales bacterium]|jgi:aerobic-type carbon monoxide dehydrogenase small subunit (CoxS/CutS family)